MFYSVYHAVRAMQQPKVLFAGFSVFIFLIPENRKLIDISQVCMWLFLRDSCMLYHIIFCI